MASIFHGSIKLISFNTNGIVWQRYELKKHLQGLRIDVVLFPKKHLKPHERFFFLITTFIKSTATQARMAQLSLQFPKVSSTITQTYALASVEATGVCINVGDEVVLLEAIYKSPGRL
jgi:hypothetical protein